eukprot:GDKI01034701.1.p1 GENE.GDKI01034701.1~~GDKI01034701.1.p1  ORF type:complete len:122 (-),score=28.27 GDKI01034701.1:58-423(-)
MCQFSALCPLQIRRFHVASIVRAHVHAILFWPHATTGFTHTHMHEHTHTIEDNMSNGNKNNFATRHSTHKPHAHIRTIEAKIGRVDQQAHMQIHKHNRANEYIHTHTRTKLHAHVHTHARA